MSTVIITTSDRQPSLSEHEGERHLEVQVAGNEVFLGIGRYTGNYATRTLELDAQITVNINMLIGAVAAMKDEQDGIR